MFVSKTVRFWFGRSSPSPWAPAFGSYSFAPFLIKACHLFGERATFSLRGIDNEPNIASASKPAARSM